MERWRGRAAVTPQIGLITTGGTIGSLGADRLDLAWYPEHAAYLSGADLLSRIPEVQAVADVEAIDFRGLSSSALSEHDWLELLEVIRGLAARDVAGIVITHGTNTLEETAYFLQLTAKVSCPIVLVGAMRPASALSSDGDLNLLNAITVAAARAARGLGVLVVLNDTVYSARSVTKIRTFRVNAFEDPVGGPVGYVDADHRFLRYCTPVHPHTVDSEFDVHGAGRLPRVFAVWSYVGSEGLLVDAAARAGAEGIVCAGTGAGRFSPLEDAALRRAREQGIVVCVASRVTNGRVIMTPGLRSREFVAAGTLLPWKARVLLALGLTRTKDTSEMQRIFDTY